MATETVFSGTVASDGIILGTAALWIPRDTRVTERTGGSTAEEHALLATTTQRAKQELLYLAQAQDKDSQDIIGLQIALLEDEKFLGPIFSMIDKGILADAAWELHLDQEIENYARSDDPNFQAIAHDLIDLNKRILGLLRAHPNPAWSANGESNLILLAHDITPSEFLSIGRETLSGLALVKGSLTSHLAMLARGRGIPMLVGCPATILSIAEGSPILLDADNNILTVNPYKARHLNVTKSAVADQFSSEPLHDGKSSAHKINNHSVNVYLNVDHPEILRDIDIAMVDGLGLLRTEFLVSNDDIPDEDQQYLIYRSVLDWSNNKPVIVRTFDFGGDKFLQGIASDRHVNSFLGVRGYRLLRLHPELFRSQLRALARAAPYGDLSVMISMVTSPSEMAEFAQSFKDVVAELASEGIECALPKLGMMVEVPAAALTLKGFDAAFFSIGTNDLIQYLMAMSRDSLQPGYLADAWELPVYQLIKECVSVASSRNIPISICGEIASLPEHIPQLLECGIRSLSVSPRQVGVVRNAIEQWRSGAT